jgi:putative flippase GtrA
MAKKVRKSNLKNATEFGFLGVIVALGFTLFWPAVYWTNIIVNSLIGYAIAFAINFVFRSIKYRNKPVTVSNN